MTAPPGSADPTGKGKKGGKGLKGKQKTAAKGLKGKTKNDDKGKGKAETQVEPEVPATIPATLPDPSTPAPTVPETPTSAAPSQPAQSPSEVQTPHTPVKGDVKGKLKGKGLKGKGKNKNGKIGKSGSTDLGKGKGTGESPTPTPTPPAAAPTPPPPEAGLMFREGCTYVHVQIYIMNILWAQAASRPPSVRLKTLGVFTAWSCCFLSCCRPPVRSFTSASMVSDGGGTVEMGPLGQLGGDGKVRRVSASMFLNEAFQSYVLYITTS